jgi:AcrR family transcriptional regulator
VLCLHCKHMLSTTTRKRKRLPARKTPARATLREVIRSTARDLFAREGYESVSMRRIANEIGCSPMAMYRHFENKDELLLSICEETFHEMTKLIDSAKQEGLPPLERLRKTLQTIIGFHVSHPNYYKVTFLTEFRNPAMAERKAAIGRPVVDRLRAGIRECAEAKGVEVDLELTTQLLRSGMHGVTLMLMMNTMCNPVQNRERLKQEMIATLTRSLE